MRTLYGTTEKMASELKSIYRYRHAVFVDRLQWDLPGAHDNLEIDQFDRPDTIHVVARDLSGALCGYARLLPTTKPYLLGEIFPTLMDGHLPCDDDIWEMSRFAATKMNHGAQTKTGEFDLWVGREVLKACVRCAVNNGISKFAAVTPLAMEKLLKRVGVTTKRAGVPTRLSGHLLYACWIEIDEKTLTSLDLCDLLSLA